MENSDHVLASEIERSERGLGALPIAVGNAHATLQPAEQNFDMRQRIFTLESNTVWFEADQG